MSIKFEISDQVSRSLRQLQTHRVPAARLNMVRAISRRVLANAAQGTPVATGRSRAAWKDAESQLSGVQETSGSVDGSGEGDANMTHTSATTLISATNQVPYIVYLEYGTSRRPPVAMLRNALIQTAGQAAEAFSILE